MTYTLSQRFTVEEFVARYGDDPRYELIDGELRDMEPTGPHESVAGKLSGRLFMEILRLNLGWTIPKSCLIQPPAAEATALRPDVIVLDEGELAAEPLWQREPILTGGNAIELVVEVVSRNWQDDYARKVEEYALLGIAEYWIVDFERWVALNLSVNRSSQHLRFVGLWEMDISNSSFAWVRRSPPICCRTYCYA
jgi:Uma2 family endonuclease